MFGHLDRGFSIAEPVDHTLHVLREFRDEFKEFVAKTDRNHEELKERIESLRQAAFGESVLGRYAAAEVEERIAALERRVSALESRG